MKFSDYVEATDSTAIYPDAGEMTVDALAYVTLGMVGEAGEVANKVKKVLRDDDGQVTDERAEQLKKEIGDVLWYVARSCRELDLDLDDVAEANIVRLEQRLKSGSLHGSGDDR